MHSKFHFGNHRKKSNERAGVMFLDDAEYFQEYITETVHKY